MSVRFLFDANRCTGCQACELACTIENGLPWGESWRRVWHFNETGLPGIPRWHLSMACNHCADAPCLRHCPSLAIGRDADSGAVLVEPEDCIGCRYCSWVCPYDAPRFLAGTGVMGKCTLCAPRLAIEREPACVALCPTGALGFDTVAASVESAGDRSEAKIPGVSETGIGPALSITDLRGGAPEMDPNLGFSDLPRTLPDRQDEPGIGLAVEWPLLVFTFLAAMLTALLYARATGAIALVTPVWLLAALLAPALSLAHLGQKKRAWRALLNIRRSWISRELLFYALFVIFGASALILAPGNALLIWLAVLLGFVALYSMDRVYDCIPGRDSRTPHSAELFLTGLFIGSALAGMLPIFALFGLLKLFSYFQRKRRFLRQGRNPQPMFILLRIVLGFVLPVFLWLGIGAAGRLWIIASLIVAELIDRLEFYLELERLTPGRQMERDLALLQSPGDAGH